jgi:N-acetyl sugar amidotransferase
MKTLYGLPEEVKFCKRCVISNQRPSSTQEHKNTAGATKSTIAFDSEGVCSACRVAEAKAKTDWEDRRKQLQRLCDRHRRNDGRFDCVVPGSGGKDSFYQTWMLKYEFGMHPLSVTWSPNIYTPWGRANHDAWIHSGFTNITMTPNGRGHRLIARLSIDNMFHPFHGFVLGQKNFGPKIAAEYGIPLVFYGENEAEYGNPLADTSTSLRSASYYTYNAHNNTLRIAGCTVRELTERYGLDRCDLNPYLPMSEEHIPDDLEVHYLGYYLKWHPQACYYHAVQHGGFQASPERTPGTYSKYNSIDDYIDDFHYYCLHTKFGIGRATYDAAQEIRSGEITRDEGVALVKKFDGEWPERSSDMVMKYLSINPEQFPVASAQFASPIMTKETFLALGETFKSPHLWDGNKLRHTVWQ